MVAKLHLAPKRQTGRRHPAPSVAGCTPTVVAWRTPVTSLMCRPLQGVHDLLKTRQRAATARGRIRLDPATPDAWSRAAGRTRLPGKSTVTMELCCR